MLNGHATGTLPCVLRWLATLQSAAAGVAARLELTGENATLSDVEHLHALLRCARCCPTLIVAILPPTLSRLSLLDLIALVIADRAIVDQSGGRDHEVGVATIGSDERGAAEHAAAADMRPIEWTPLQPVLEHFVEQLWQGAVSSDCPSMPRRPATVADLRLAGIFCAPTEVEALQRRSRHRCCLHPEFLLAMRRAGTLRVRRLDKMSFNYYWVTKVLLLSSLDRTAGLQATHPAMRLSAHAATHAPREGGTVGPANDEAKAPSSLPAPAIDVQIVSSLALERLSSPQYDARTTGPPSSAPHRLLTTATSLVAAVLTACESQQSPLPPAPADTLVLTLQAQVIDMPAAAISDALLPALARPGLRAVLVLLPAAERAELCMRALPAHDGAYKWHRKWELLLQRLVRTAPVAAVLCGDTCPPLLDLFFACHARAWHAKSAVGFGATGYVPGPTAFHGLSHLGRATLRSLLLHGLPLTPAIDARIVSARSRSHRATPLLGLPELLSEAAACASSAGGGRAPPPAPCWGMDALSTPLADVLTLTQGIAAPPPIIRAPREWAVPCACITGLGLSLPSTEHEFTQAEVCTLLGLGGGAGAAGGTPSFSLGGATDDRDRDPALALRRIFAADHIERRTIADVHATAATAGASGQGELTRRHLRWARALVADAVTAACADAGMGLADVRCLCICSSTGYLLPGLTAHAVRDLGLSREVCRLDVVGMGCHAGLNAVQAAANWATAHPGELAIACAVEVCSAHYLWNACTNSNGAATVATAGTGGTAGATATAGIADTAGAALNGVDASTASAADGQRAGPTSARAARINHAVVNSLFADGCFAAALVAPVGGAGVLRSGGGCGYYAALHSFASLTAPEAIDTMQYCYDERSAQFYFLLDELAPYAVGAGLCELRSLLQRKGVPVDACRHWVVHTGGQYASTHAPAPHACNMHITW